MIQLNTHLMFNGQCETAFKVYEACLGAKIAFMMTYGDSPLSEQTPADFRKKILHGRLTLGNDDLTGADVLPEQYARPQGFAVQLNLADAEEADRIFKTLSEKGIVQMPLQETFWALRFGVLV